MICFAQIPFCHCVESVSCGKEHVLILTDKGTVFSFGGGRYIHIFDQILCTTVNLFSSAVSFFSRGQIGNGSLDQQDEPKPIEVLTGINMRVISCGGWHSAVLSSK